MGPLGNKLKQKEHLCSKIHDVEACRCHVSLFPDDTVRDVAGMSSSVHEIYPGQLAPELASALKHCHVLPV